MSSPLGWWPGSRDVFVFLGDLCPLGVRLRFPGLFTTSASHEAGKPLHQLLARLRVRGHAPVIVVPGLERHDGLGQAFPGKPFGFGMAAVITK